MNYFLPLLVLVLSQAHAGNPLTGIDNYSSVVKEANGQCSGLNLIQKVSNKVSINPFSEKSINSAFEWIENDGKQHCYSRVGVLKAPYFCMTNSRSQDSVVKFDRLIFQDSGTRGNSMTWEMDQTGCNPARVDLDLNLPSENNKDFFMSASFTPDECRRHLKNMVEGKDLELNGQGEFKLGEPVSKEKEAKFCKDKHAKNPQYAVLVARAAYRVTKCLEAFPRLLNDHADSLESATPKAGVEDPKSTAAKQ